MIVNSILNVIEGLLTLKQKHHSNTFLTNHRNRISFQIKIKQKNFIFSKRIVQYKIHFVFGHIIGQLFACLEQVIFRLYFFTVNSELSFSSNKGHFNVANLQIKNCRKSIKIISIKIFYNQKIFLDFPLNALYLIIFYKHFDFLLTQFLNVLRSQINCY